MSKNKPILKSKNCGSQHIPNRIISVNHINDLKNKQIELIPFNTTFNTIFLIEPTNRMELWKSCNVTCIPENIELIKDLFHERQLRFMRTG